MYNAIEKCVFISILICIIILADNDIYAQNPGFHYSYDAAGNRTQRTYTTVFIKKGDTTAVESIVSDYKIKVYPNPFKDYLRIEILGLLKDNKIKYQLIDLEGCILLNYEDKNSAYEINTKDLVSGTYFLNIYIDDKKSFWKIIKEE